MNGNKTFDIVIQMLSSIYFINFKIELINSIEFSFISTKERGKGGSPSGKAGF